MISHFHEIADELKQKYAGILHENIILLLWLPRLYRNIEEQLPGTEHKIGIWDTFNLKDKNISIIDAFNSSQIIDLLNFVSILGSKKIIAIGLAGSYDLKIGTFFVPEKAYNEDIIISHYTKEKISNFNRDLFNKNKGQIEKFANEQGKNLEFGSIVSLDLFSRETKDFLNNYKDKVQCVDLEVAPLYLMCQKHNIQCFAFMIISDILHKSYFLRENKEITIYHELCKSLPSLINDLKF